LNGFVGYCIYKGNEKMGIRNKEKRERDTKGIGEWVSIWHIRRAKSVELVGSDVIHVLHAGIFLLDADMKSVLLFHSPVTIQSM
jgi:hypothetical protein